MQLTIQPVSISSDVTVQLPTPTNYSGGNSWNPFMMDVRAMTAVDLNRDGYRDIFLHPSYISYGPGLAPIALINDGNGRFTDGTTNIFRNIPTLNQTNGTFFSDFNSDGRIDLFVVDQGLETGGVNQYQGAQNRLFLQDSQGIFQDATATLPNNVASFNHVSTMADINSDGNQDIILTRLGGPIIEGSGTLFYLGDGNGGFSFSTAGLPEEIKYIAASGRQWSSTTIDYQFSGSNGVGDLNNDGRQDLITGSYTDGDQLTDAQTVRIFQQDATGNFNIKWQGNQPTTLIAALGVMGVAGIVTGDLDGDNLQDIVVRWENAGTNAVQILKNLGNSQFRDVTVDSLGSYLIRNGQRDSTGDFAQQNMLPKLIDANHDGKLDLALSNMNSTASQVVNGLSTGAFLYINDGTGKFNAWQPAVDDRILNAQELTATIGSPEWSLGAPMVFDTNNDGKDDFVFIGSENNLDQTVVPYRPTNLHISTLLGTTTSHVYRANDTGETLRGTSEADKFISGLGNDEFNGGSGTDTLVVAGNRKDFTIMRVGENVQVSDAYSNDTLNNIERIQFKDATINLTISANAQSIAASDLKMLQELYVAFFNRVPDADGLDYWINQFKSGQSFASIADSFYSAAVQYTSLTGYSTTLSNDDFVKVVYKNVLGRTGDTAPTASEVDYWSSELANGNATKGSLVSTMLNSAHSFKGNQQWGWVADLLDNKVAVAEYFAVQQGMNYNTAEDSIAKGMAIAAAVTATDTTAARQLIGSDTLTNIERIQFNDAMIALDVDGNAGKAYRLYKAAFDRAPDLPGLGFWIEALDKGESLTTVAGAFVNSDEFKSMYGAQVSTGTFVTKLYNNVLDRDPEAAGFDHWTNSIDGGAITREQALVGFSESAENQANLIGVMQNGFEYDPWNG